MQATLQKVVQVQSSLSGTSKTAIKGYEKVLKKFETSQGVNFSIALFGLCEKLATMLQWPVYHVEAKEASEAPCDHLARLQSDTSFHILRQQTNPTAGE